MSQSVIYMRGFPGHGAQSMLGDLKCLLKVEQDKLSAFAERLAHAEGFVSKKQLQEAIEADLGIEDEEDVTAIARAIRGLRTLARDYNRTPTRVLEDLKEKIVSDENPGGTLTQEDYTRIGSLVSILDRPFPALDLQDKARRLGKVLGHSLEEIQVICDLRPIFSEAKDAVRGMIPFTTLKVVCEGTDGLPVSIEAVLSKQQVDELLEKVEGAKKKLETLNDLLARQQIAVPTTMLTLEAKKRSEGDNAEE